MIGTHYDPCHFWFRSESGKYRDIQKGKVSHPSPYTVLIIATETLVLL